MVEEEVVVVVLVVVVVVEEEEVVVVVNIIGRTEIYFRLKLDVRRGNKERGDGFLKSFLGTFNFEQLDKLVEDMRSPFPLPKGVKFTAVPQAEGRGQQFAETVA